MRFRLTHHAEQELTRRGTPRTILEQALEMPQQIVPAYGGRKAYQSQVEFGSGRTFLLRVIVDDRTVPPTVVTAYRTSKISKYWRQSHEGHL